MEMLYDKFSTNFRNDMARKAFFAAQAKLAERNFIAAQAQMAAYRAVVNYDDFFVRDNRACSACAASVIIVAYHTGRELVKCVMSVLSGLCRNIEVIVVDNGGNDDVIPILEKLPILYVRAPFNVLPSEGRNIGVSRAKSPIGIFLDDDAVALPDFAANALAAFNAPGVLAVRGKIEPKTEKSFLGAVPHYDLGNNPFPHPVDTEGNSAWRLCAYIEAGGMDPLLHGHEGLDLSSRLERSYGRCVFYWPGMRILHDYAVSEEKDWRKRIRHSLMSKYRRWKMRGR
jgi:GT2 family glycosyltransferase